MSMTTTSADLLIRSEIWENELKEVFQEELMAQSYVRWLPPTDGNLRTIPSIGEATARDYQEDTAVVYDALDTGEFQFSVTEYLSSGLYITKKARQDSAYAAELEAAFVPSEARAISERVETDVLALGAAGASGGQTAGDTNSINGAQHRFVASGTDEVIAIKDFSRAKYALKKAQVRMVGMIAIVDPSVAYELETQANILNLSNNPMWEGLVAEGGQSDMRFTRNVMGVDVWVSDFLADAGAAQDGAETIGTPSVTTGKCNLFFSAADGRNLPFIGEFRQMPEVDAEYNKDKQREEYVTTARYGLKVYRPENLVVILSDTDQVYA